MWPMTVLFTLKVVLDANDFAGSPIPVLTPVELCCAARSCARKKFCENP
jgi:hypothetical protein